MAPPAGRVPGLMKDLLGWLKRKDAHPLISSCVFHYELEFIRKRHAECHLRLLAS